MTKELSMKERKILSDFIAQEESNVPVISEKIVPLFTGIIMFAGAAMFGASAVSIVQGMAENGLTPFALPGLIAGVGIILFGTVLQKYLKMRFQRLKVVHVLKSLLN